VEAASKFVHKFVQNRTSARLASRARVAPRRHEFAEPRDDLRARRTEIVRCENRLKFYFTSARCPLGCDLRPQEFEQLFCCRVIGQSEVGVEFIMRRLACAKHRDGHVGSLERGAKPQRLRGDIGMPGDMQDQEGRAITAKVVAIRREL
jgi:hypothetical protein